MSKNNNLLQCMNYPIPPCGLLMLRVVTPAHKRLALSGFLFLRTIFTIRAQQLVGQKTGKQYAISTPCFAIVPVVEATEFSTRNHNRKEGVYFITFTFINYFVIMSSHVHAITFTSLDSYSLSFRIIQRSFHYFSGDPVSEY